jgi:hypothetical protein
MNLNLSEFEKETVHNFITQIQEYHSYPTWKLKAIEAFRFL